MYEHKWLKTYCMYLYKKRKIAIFTLITVYKKNITLYFAHIIHYFVSFSQCTVRDFLYLITEIVPSCKNKNFFN